MPGSSVSFVLYFVAVGAGVSIALQQILNPTSRIELGSPWWAGFVSYFVGTLAMLAAILISGGPLLSPATAARTSWISWTGGIFGALFIGTAILDGAAAGSGDRARAGRGRPDDRLARLRPFRPARGGAARGEPDPPAGRGIPGHRRRADRAPLNVAPAC